MHWIFTPSSLSLFLSNSFETYKQIEKFQVFDGSILFLCLNRQFKVQFLLFFMQSSLFFLLPFFFFAFVAGICPGEEGVLFDFIDSIENLPQDWNKSDVSNACDWTGILCDENCISAMYFFLCLGWQIILEAIWPMKG